MNRPEVDQRPKDIRAPDLVDPRWCQSFVVVGPMQRDAVKLADLLLADDDEVDRCEVFSPPRLRPIDAAACVAGLRGREVLFDRLKLPVKRKTKSGPSTDSAVLEELSDLHPLPSLVLQFRSFAKLKGYAQF